MEIIPVDYSLASMLNDLANKVHTRADQKGLIINIKVNSNIPDLLHGDEIRVKQVITNILTNAVKYTEKGSVTFSVDYEKIDSNDEDIILKVAVSDTGIGIKEEDMSKLFSEFDRIEEKRNRNIEGTGLGMAITQSLLKKTKIRIDSADSGDGAIKAACSKKYDIIFLDHMMPKKDGIETLHELKLRGDNLNNDTTIVCLTANAISGMREKYISEGFDDYLTKPIDSVRLEDMLMKYLPPEKVFPASEEDVDDEE